MEFIKVTWTSTLHSSSTVFTIDVSHMSKFKKLPLSHRREKLSRAPKGPSSWQNHRLRSYSCKDFLPIPLKNNLEHN